MTSIKEKKQERNKGKSNSSLMAIIKWYALIIVVVIIIFVSIISQVFSRQWSAQEEDALRQAVMHVEDLYAEDLQRVTWMVDRLLGDSDKIENVQKYFDMETAEYLKYSIEQNISELAGDYYFLPREVNNLYLEDDWLTSVSFTFNQLPEIFYSDVQNKGGYLTDEYPGNAADIYFTKVFFGNASDEVLGTFKIAIDRQKYDNVLAHYQNGQPIQLLILSASSNQPLYQTAAAEADWQDEERYIAEEMTLNGYTFVGLISRSQVESTIRQKLLLLWAGSCGVIVLLIAVLYRLLISYHRNVHMILTGIHQVSQGDISVRLPEQKRNPELLEITRGINQMLANINDYILDNYRLEAEQREANMRALQSQINPHFLYNTLEYIRMYAVNVNAPELANVVFSFSSLLRNNISQEQFTTLAKEINFCEKYAYLYQMRYPDCLAYSFQVAADVQDQQIPKFIIQPLIENYFIHGVDFEKIDNAGCVVAYRQQQRIVIEVSDNGKGIAPAVLAQLQEPVADSSEIRQGRSIGINNIRERLRLYYAGDFTMQFMNNQPRGTIVQITIPMDKEVKRDV